MCEGVTSGLEFLVFGAVVCGVGAVVSEALGGMLACDGEAVRGESTGNPMREISDFEYKRKRPAIDLSYVSRARIASCT